MDADNWDLGEYGLESADCPHCHKRQWFKTDDAEHGLIELSCDDCGNHWTYNIYEGDELAEPDDDNWQAGKTWTVECPNCHMDHLIQVVSNTPIIHVAVECDMCGHVWTYDLYEEKNDE